MSDARWYWQVVRYADKDSFDVVAHGTANSIDVAKRISARKVNARFLKGDTTHAEVWKQVRYELEPGTFEWFAPAHDDDGTVCGVVYAGEVQVIWD